MTPELCRALAAAHRALGLKLREAGDGTYTDHTGRFHLAAADAYDAEAARLAPAPPSPPPVPDPPPPPASTDYDTTQPLIVSEGQEAIGWRVHDTPGAPEYPTAVTIREGGTFADSVVENVAQAVFAARTVTVRNVRTRMVGVAGKQAHHFYVRHGLLEGCVAESFKPDAGHDSCSFHAHREDGWVENLIWRDCTDLTSNDAVMAGYVGVRNCTIDGFTKAAGKTRLGVAGKANGRNTFRRLDVATLQIDGTFAPGTVVAGRCRELVTGGGPGMSKTDAEARWPEVDFSGLTIG